MKQPRINLRSLSRKITAISFASLAVLLPA